MRHRSSIAILLLVAAFATTVRADFNEEVSMASAALKDARQAAESLLVESRLEECNAKILATFPNDTRTAVQAFILGNVLFQQDPKTQTRVARAATKHDHEETLKGLVRGGTVALRNPMTGISSERGWMGDADSWLLTRSQMKAFCDLLAIELVDRQHFITSAWPDCVPPELLALDADARISYENNIGGGGSGTCSAAARVRCLPAACRIRPLAPSARLGGCGSGL